MVIFALEGIDGSGKDTQFSLLKKELASFSFFSYPDRNSIYWQSLIRPFLFKEISLSPIEVYLAYLADIVKDKEKWKNAILSRYATSTIAYESALGVDINVAINIATSLLPKINIIYLDIPISVAANRLKDKNKDRFEENLQFLEKVRENYILLSKRQILGKWKIIDATKAPEEISKEILNYIKELSDQEF